MSVFVGAVGVDLELEIQELDSDGNPAAVDISSATGMSFYIQKPDGTVLTKTPSLSGGGGTDGKVKYSTVAGDLDQEGVYLVQWEGTIGSWTGRSTAVGLNVFRALG